MLKQEDLLIYFSAILVLCLIPSIHGTTTASKAVKDGFYKISNVKDGTVLTATRKGPRPHQVITEAWRNEPVQQWKVKSRLQDGVPLQIIRNEQIRENEVTKEANYIEGSGKDWIPLDWNFMTDPSGADDTYVLFNGIGCLIGNGKGERILISYCDESAPNPDELWKVEYLHPIPKK